MATRTADLPVGFRLETDEDDLSVSAELPEGFRLDVAPDELPSGFHVEQPQAPSPQLLPLTGGKTFLGRQLYTTDAGEIIGDRVIAITSPALNNGRPTLIPTIFDGQIVPDSVAIDRVLSAGGVDPETGRALPGFDTEAEALSAVSQMNRAPAPSPTSVQIPETMGGEAGAPPSLTVPTGPIRGVPTPAPAPPAPPEDPAEPTFADFLSDITEAVQGVPGALKSAAAAAWEGDNPEEIAKAKDWADKVISERRARSTENFAMEGADTTYVDVGPIQITRADLRNLPDNVGFSLVSMLSGLAAGGATFLVGGPLGFEAGVVTSGLAAYRMDTNQALRQLRDGLDRAALHDLGRPLTDDEWLSIAESEDMQAAAYRLGMTWNRSANPMEEIKKHGLHEAGWEAIGNAVLFSAGKAMFKLAKQKSLLKAAGAWTGGTTVEVLSEAQTNIGQQGVEVRLGLQDGEEPSFLSAADQAAAIREVAGPTVLLTGVMGAGAAGAGLVTGAIQDAHRARVIRQEIENADLGDPETIARNSLTPRRIRGWDERGRPIMADDAGREIPSEPGVATYTESEVAGLAERRLAEINRKAEGTPNQTVTDPESGEPRTVRGEPAQMLTDAEKRERDFLQRNIGNPQALADGYGLALGSHALPAQTETSDIGLQESPWGHEIPAGFHLVDDDQGHPVSTDVSSPSEAAPPPPPTAPQNGASVEPSNVALEANQQTIQELERLASQTENPAMRQRLLRDAQLLRAEAEGRKAKMTPWERSRRAREVRPEDDLITAIRKLGGIDTSLESDWQDRLKHLDKETRAFGMPSIERPGKGLSLDALTELLMDYGYVQNKDAHELEELLWQAETGMKVYTKSVEAEQRERDLAESIAAIEAEESTPDAEWDDILTAAWEDLQSRPQTQQDEGGGYSDTFGALREEAEAVDAAATESILERAAIAGWDEREASRQLLNVIRGTYGQDSAAAPGRTASPQGARGEGQVQPGIPGADNERPAQGGQAAPAEEGQSLPALTERRQDAAQRKRVADMTPEEKDRELLTSRRAGIWNDRAYEEHERLPVQVSVDLDGLKWINDTLGHEAGDQLLRAMGDAVRGTTDRGYHISGDEFVLQARTEDEARALVERINATAERATITVELPDGSTITKKGVGFSYGIGQDLATAETGLQQHKAERERAGLRSSRGGEPAGVVRTPAQGQQDREGGNAEVPGAPEEADTLDHGVLGQISSISAEDLEALIDEEAGSASVPDTAKPASQRAKAGKSSRGTSAPRKRRSKPEATDVSSKDGVDRTAGEIAKSLGYNVSSAGAEAIKGLTELFGGSGKLNSGLSFDEKTYAKAKPHFEAMLRDAVAAGRDLRDFIRTVLNAFGTGVKPYLMRFAADVQAGTVDVDGRAAQNDREEIRGRADESDERGGADLERDRGDAETGDGMGQEGVPDGPGSDGGIRGQGIRGPGGEGGRSDGGDQSYRRDPASGGTDGDQPVSGDASGTEVSATGAGDGQRSGDLGIEGAPAESVSAEATAKSAAKPSDLAERIRAQKSADKIGVVLHDRDNIDETLPLLSDGQRADVHFAETRFALPNGYGVLFTNGTGTGKTFSGLGIIKRFSRRGKNNIVVVVPSDKIASDWIRSGEMLGLDIHPLKSTKDAGAGIVITTYANFGDNDTIVNRQWDLVVADESHYFMSSKDGTQTKALSKLRALTMHQKYASWARTRSIMRDAFDEIERINDTITANIRILNSDDTMDQMASSARDENQRLTARRDDLNAAIDAHQKKEESAVEAAQGAARPRVVLLSATPFAYEKSVDYAEGYLFEYPEDGGSGYNSGSQFDRFMMQHFGYRMRYNKLTEPPPEVDRGLLQRQFNSWLKKENVLSSRTIDVPFDYDRRFVLVESAVGQKIDEGMEWLREDPSRRILHDIIAKKFDHLTRRYLLEAIKARESIPIVKAHLAAGRKVVVFHDFKKGGGFNPFDVRSMLSSSEVTVVPAGGGSIEVKHADLARDFIDQRPDLVNLPLSGLASPIATYQREFPDALIFNGDVSKGDRRKAVELFQDDNSGRNLILVQSAAGKEGISLHDTTGGMSRVLFNLGLPTQPTTAIQQEGRIFRMGQASNAMFRYFNTGTSWERIAFADTIARRSSTAENLALGEEARALMDAFVEGFQESDSYPVGMEGEGTGGKERDDAARSALSDWDRAKTLYFAQQKKTSRTKAQEGKDYFATPEPIGMKMVEWADVRGGESVLEPSAGHGAIARWFPELADRTVVEPSTELFSRLRMVTDAKAVQSSFEDHNIVNKYDAVVMNPPFGMGGSTAIPHLAKAARHLRDRGRIVAIIPTGPAADKKFDAWLYSTTDKGKRADPSAESMYVVADIRLPNVTFERAGANVATRIVVLDKVMDPEEASRLIERRRDYSDVPTIGALFERIEDLEIPGRRRVSQQPGREEITTAPQQGEPRAEAGDAPFTIAQTRHAKKGIDLFVASFSARVPREVYDQANQAAKRHGGYYSAYRGQGAIPGFQFESEADRAAFLAEFGGGSVREDRGEYSIDQTETPEFRRWFGDSKVVDADGKPLVVYHGTGSDVTQFNRMAWGSADPRLAGEYAEMRGEWYGGQANVMPAYMSIRRPFDADTLSTRASFEYPDGLSVTRFIDQIIEQSGANESEQSELRALEQGIRAAARQEESGPSYSPENFWYRPAMLFGEDGARQIRRVFEIAGFDGIRLTEQGAVTYGVFNPEQIKSAVGNTGAFDPNDPNILREEGVPHDPALYSGYERAPSSVQGGERRERGVSSPPGGDRPGAQTELLFDLPADADSARAQLADNFYVRYRQVPTGEVNVGVDRVLSSSDAAHVLAQFRKHGQEVALFLVLDKDGAPLSVINHAKGTIDGTSIYPHVVAGSIASTPGAAYYWMGHNHPSGNPNPSGADLTITRRINQVLEASGIEMAGHVILSRGRTATLIDRDGTTSTPIETTAAPRKKRVPITERIIRKQPPFGRPKVANPSSAIGIVRDANLRNGLLLLDTHHNVAGTIAFGPGEMQALRQNGRVRRILTGLGETNAGAVIIVSESRDDARNMARYLNSAHAGEIRVLDAIIREGDGLTSDASVGGALAQESGTWFQRSPVTKAAFEYRIDELFRDENPRRVGFRVLDSSDVLELLGYGRGMVRLNERKVVEGKYNHGLTAAHWKQIPEWLENPVAVFDSDTVPGRLVFIAPETVNGAPVFMIVEPNANRGGSDVHLLVNAYDKTQGKPPFDRWVRDGLLRYLDEKKSLAFDGTTGLTTPGDSTRLNRGRSQKVFNDRDLVKLRAGRTSLRRTADPAIDVSAEAVEAVETAVRAQLQDVPGAAWEVVPTEADLPAAVRQIIAREGATGQVSAVYHDGTIYYVAAKLDSPLAVEVATLHELDGHIGFERLFGDEARLAGNDLFMRLGGLSGIQTLASTHGIDFAPYVETAKKIDGIARRNHYLVNELLAHLQESRATASLPERIKQAIKAYWGAIRQYLRTHNFKWIGTEFTDSDLAHLLRSMSRAARGKGVTSVHRAPKEAWFQRKVTAAPLSLPNTATIQPMDILRPLGQPPADREVAGTDLAPFLDRLRGEEDAKELFVRTVHQFEDRFKDARRGKISWDETEAMARSLGWTADKLMERRKGQSFNAEEWEAARTIVDGAMSEVLEAARAAEGGNDADLVRFHQRLSKFVPLAEQVLGARAEWGRVGAIMRKQAQQAKALGDILDSMGGRMTIEAKAKALNDLAASGASPETLRQTVTKVAKIRFIDKVVEAWINGLLSGPQTHAVNIASNQLIAILSVPEHAIAAAIGKLHGGTDKVYMREIMPRAWGLLSGAREGALLGATVFNSAAKRLHLAQRQAAREGLTGAAAKQRTREIVDKVRALSGDRPANATAEQDMLWDIRDQAGKLEEGTDFFEKVDTGYQKAIGGRPGKVVRVPGNFLQSQDEFYKAIAFRMDLNSRALRQGIREGLSGTALHQRAEEIAHKVAALRGLDRPAQVTPEEAVLWDMRDELVHFSRYQTFTNPLGPLGRTIQSIAARWPFPFRFIMPFIRTPVNIVKFAGHRSPIAPLMPSFREEWSKGGAARDQAIARMVFGTGLGMTVMMMAMQGAITGGGPSDPDERRIWLQKYRPYSIKVGDTWYSYGRLEPLGMIMGVAADIATVAHIMPDAELEEVMGLLYSSVVKNLASKTFLSGISNAVAAYYDPERYGDAWIQQFAGTLIPTGVAQVARVNDPVLRRADTIVEKWKSRIPGLTGDLLPRRDIFGEPIALGGGLGPDIISPVYLGVDPHDPVVDEMIRLGVTVSPPQQRIGGVELTPLQYDEYAQMVGQTAKRVLDQMVSQPSFEGLPDPLREEMIDSVFKMSREQARAVMMARYPDIIRQGVQQRVESMQERAGE